MTTIAWDGLTMASDSQCSYHSMDTQKVHRLNDGSLVGLAGNSGLCLRVMRALERGKTEPYAPGDYSYLRVWPDGRAEVSAGDGAIPMPHRFFAIGSGSDYAMGAMAMHATAAEAVRVASMFDSDTGGRVHTMAHVQPTVAAVGHA